MGTYAYSVPGKVRFVLKPEAEITEGVMPGDIARTWIRTTFHLPQFRRFNQARRYVLPLLARTGTRRDCAYVDLRGAYRTILAIAGWDTDFQLAGWLRGSGTGLPRTIAENKRCYAMAVSASAQIRSTLYRLAESGLVPSEIPNIYANTSLYALASALLASVARDIITRMPVYYVNTDGYIVPVWCAPLAVKIANAWGFEARIKHSGDTHVYGYASYSIGGYSTVHQQGRGGNYSTALPTREERNWLYKVWTRQIQRYNIR